MTAKATNRLAIGGHTPTDIWSELHRSFCHSSAFVNPGSCFRPKWPLVILVFNQYDSAGYNKTESATLRLHFSSHLVSSHLRNRFIAFGVTRGVHVWVKAGTPGWVGSSWQGPVWAFVCLGPCSRVPPQCSDHFLPPSPTTETPSMFCLHWHSNREPAVSKASWSPPVGQGW